MVRRPSRAFVSSVAALLLFAGSSFSQSDEDCLACHGDRGLTDQEGKSLFVASDTFLASAHGKANISCVSCHADLRGTSDFPHPAKLPPARCAECHEATAREASLSVHALAKDPSGNPRPVGCAACHGSHEIKGKNDFDSAIFPLNLPATCEKCHLENVPSAKGSDFVRQYGRSVHFKALKKSGLTMSANCVHCHGSHDIQPAESPRSPVSRPRIVRTCGTCHVGIERDYLEGVHGKDYVKGVRDVPVCTDCHGEHDILAPQDSDSRVYATRVAAVCSRCHDDVVLSRQYGFLTSRLKTYSESFHGTASKFGETRVANCASCHGYHDIRASNDPRSSIHQANLPETCGRCHPGASRRFAEGKIHFSPEEAVPAKYRSSHIVKNIYLIVIAVIIGVMLLFISADLLRRLIHRKHHG